MSNKGKKNGGGLAGKGPHPPSIAPVSDVQKYTTMVHMCDEKYRKAQGAIRTLDGMAMKVDEALEAERTKNASVVGGVDRIRETRHEERKAKFDEYTAFIKASEEQEEADVVAYLIDQVGNDDISAPGGFHGAHQARVDLLEKENKEIKAKTDALNKEKNQAAEARRIFRGKLKEASKNAAAVNVTKPSAVASVTKGMSSMSIDSKSNDLGGDAPLQNIANAFITFVAKNIDGVKDMRKIKHTLLVSAMQHLTSRGADSNTNLKARINELKQLYPDEYKTYNLHHVLGTSDGDIGCRRLRTYLQLGLPMDNDETFEELHAYLKKSALRG